MGARVRNRFRLRIRQSDSGNKPSQRTGNADTQSEENEGVLGIVSGLESVIPLVEQLGHVANKTDRQDKRGDYE